MPLKAVASAVPKRLETSQQVADQAGVELDFLEKKVGVKQRYILSQEETGIGLSAEACQALFKKTGLSPDDVELLVYVTQNPDRRLPNNAGGLADALGLPKSLASFDVSLGCSGFVYALSIVEAMLTAYGMQNAIIVTCDPYSRIMAAEDKATNAVFGDAAAATWVTADGPGGRLSGIDFGTDGSGADAIRIDAGGAAMPMVSLDQSDGTATYDREALRLHMMGRDVFNFVNAQIPKSIEASLSKADKTADDIDFFALHQGSLYMLQALAKRARIPMEKVLINIDRYGNTVSSTIPLLLEDLLEKEDCAGRHILISGFGVGLSWATGLLSFD